MTVALDPLNLIVEVAAPPARPWPPLRSVATAVPPLLRRQEDIAATMAAHWNLKGAALSRWRRIIAGSEIDQRHGVMPPEEVIHLSTAQRMAAFERHAPAIAVQAGARAMERAAVTADRITDLIVVSCTGFSAPGLDVALCDGLKLNQSVRRTNIGFMGCFGAISGLRTAVGACAANAADDPIALVVCVELCSLHMRADADESNQIASALFGDGAAAAVVGGWPRRDSNRNNVSDASAMIGRINTGASLLLPHGRDWMTWRVTDAGFAMTLARQVPAALRECLGSFVANDAGPRMQNFIIHPGGPGILNAVDDALGLHGGSALEAARTTLRRFGNMSSATVLFVLEQALRTGLQRPAMMLAFGPGLTIESLQILPDET